MRDFEAEATQAQTIDAAPLLAAVAALNRSIEEGLAAVRAAARAVCGAGPGRRVNVRQGTRSGLYYASVTMYRSEPAHKAPAYEVVSPPSDEPKPYKEVWDMSPSQEAA